MPKQQKQRARGNARVVVSVSLSSDSHREIQRAANEQDISRSAFIAEAATKAADRIAKRRDANAA